MKLITNNGKVLSKNENKIIVSFKKTLKKLLDTTRQSNYLFYYYEGENVNGLISYSDTENVISMKSMFYRCTNLQTIPQLNTSNVENIGNMFYACYKLKNIDISSLDKIDSTSKISSFAYDCRSLTKLIIRNMTVIPPLSSNSFSNCYHFKGTVNSTYNPEGLKDGRIYVPDNMVDSLKKATNWSAYADIIVPLSTLEE